ncbi:7394_t:CDS:2 [Paraglomus brasilianum]|uniref:RNA helicase n=1 Tax=Paraglomus brasilianum TaxID=144538 RepID=A0A9N9CHS7_9GLOM|nr:7394_t:CDS:2 [Paraglomus brasilianum]
MKESKDEKKSITSSSNKKRKRESELKDAGIKESKSSHRDSKKKGTKVKKSKTVKSNDKSNSTESDKEGLDTAVESHTIKEGGRVKKSKKTEGSVDISNSTKLAKRKGQEAPDPEFKKAKKSKKAKGSVQIPDPKESDKKKRQDEPGDITVEVSAIKKEAKVKKSKKITESNSTKLGKEKTSETPCDFTIKPFANDQATINCKPKTVVEEEPGVHTKASWKDYYSKHGIAVDSEIDIPPIMSFSQLNVNAHVKQVLGRFKEPTPIQAVCWGIGLSGRDVIGIAETGSGKTLAFLVPAMTHISRSKDNFIKTKVLILAPTRELALQIEAQCKEFEKTCGFKSLCVYGGVQKSIQRQALREGAHILVATPGRLVDFVNERSCDLSGISFLVLDEADRMLDKGFEDVLRLIVSKLPKKRQTAMFSATWPELVRRLAHDFLCNAVKVNIGSEELSANNNIKQIVEVLEDRNQKEGRLLRILNQYHKNGNRVLIFVLYKAEAIRLENALVRQGFEAQAIHGDKNQYQRMQALQAFRDGYSPLLVATDVASRGLDIPMVEYVINYTFPLTIEDYVHRIGRTGRAGKTGISHTFFTSYDKAHSGELINVLKSAGQCVPPELMKFGTTVKRKEHSAYGAFYREIDPNVKPTKIKFDEY